MRRQIGILSLAAAVAMVPTCVPLLSAASVVAGTNGKIVFISNRDGKNDLWVMDADGSNPARLSQGTGNYADPRWSPDHSKVAFRNDRDGDIEIYVIDADGGPEHQLTHNTVIDAEPSWSPNGRLIAFSTTRDGNAEIYTMTSAGSDLKRLTHASANDWAPDWSPDGTEIVFWRVSSGVSAEVMLMNSDGSGVHMLNTENTGDDSYPAWSPDGSKIAFAGSGDLFVMSADGTGRSNITSTPSQAEFRPAWSPDGSMIAFYAHTGDNWEVFRLPSSGGSHTNLTQNSGSDASASWAADVPADATGPTTTITAPTAPFALGSTVVRWTGSDNAGGSGINHFQVRYRRALWNGTFTSLWSLPAEWQDLPPSQRQVRRSLRPGHTFCFAVRAVDGVGNVGAWSPARCVAAPVDDRSLARSKGWTSASGPEYYRHTLTTTSLVHRRLSLTNAHVTRVALVVTKCPTCGRVKVLAGRKVLGRVNLFASRTRNKQIVVLPAFALRTTTIKIRTTTRGKLVKVDGLGISQG